jgi:chromosome segregation ATPase
MRSLSILLPVLLLAACAAPSKQECDPSVEINVLSKARCTYAGVYDERVSDLQLSVAQQQQVNRDLQAALDAVKSEQAQVSAELAGRNQEYTVLNAAVKRLNDTLAAKSRENAALKQQLDSINATLAEVNTPSDSTLQKQTQLDALRRQLADLQAQVGQ